MEGNGSELKVCHSYALLSGPRRSREGGNLAPLPPADPLSLWERVRVRVALMRVKPPAAATPYSPRLAGDSWDLVARSSLRRGVSR